TVMWLARGVTLVILLVLPVTVFGQSNPNNSSFNAADFQINSVAVQSNMAPPGVISRWWTTFARAGRSYCAIVTPGDGDRQASRASDSVVFGTNDAFAPIVSNNNATTEPSGDTSSRACWVQNVSQRIFVLVQGLFVTESFAFRFRIVETTLFGD